MQDWLIQFIPLHPYLIYLVIILLACAEGPILSMIGGILIRLGYFDLWPIYLALMAGDLLGDVGWYYVGRYYGHSFINRFGKYFNITEKGVAKVTEIFHRYKHRILIISKISNGFGLSLVTLITAGIVKIPFWRYLATNLIGQFIWTGLLISVGYFFSHLYLLVNTWLERSAIIAAFILIILAFNGYRKYLTNRANNFNI